MATLIISVQEDAASALVTWLEAQGATGVTNDGVPFDAEGIVSVEATVTENVDQVVTLVERMGAVDLVTVT